MKTMFKKNGKRVLSAALCLLMAVMSLPLSAFAWTSEEGRSCTSSFGDYYVGLDGEYYRSQATMHTLVYNDDGSTYVKSYSSGNAKRKYLMTDNSGTHQVYCVESGIDFNTGNTYTSKSGQNSSYFKNLPTDAQFGVMMALMYGWHEGKSSPVAGTNADDYAYATQSIIWEYQQQLRTSPADLHSANGIPADMYYSSIKGRPAEKCYNWILSQMADHYTIPSFAARNQSKANTYTLKYNPDTQKYSLTIEDTNNTLSNIKFSASGISVSRSGNKYTFTSDKMITSPVTVSAQKQVNLNTDDMLIWGCVGKQTMISGASDPVYFYFKIDTETYGTGHIKKTSEDGVVSGIKFNISGNGVNKTVTTKADGTVDIQLMPGIYTVAEQSIDRYEPQSVQRVTIVSGHTSTVTFNNTLKRGDLEIIKNSEDNLVEGVKFHLYGTSLSGLPVDEYAVTDAKGVAKFSNVLISGDTPYVVEEIDTAVRYVVPASQTAPIEWEKVTSRTFVNVLKKFNVTVTKSDVETGTEQGDASLAGAVYVIYKGEELIDTYTTDGNGQFTSKYYICGDDWTVRELTPSEGYLLDPTIHKVGAEPELYTVEYNSTANDVTEQVIKWHLERFPRPSEMCKYRSEARIAHLHSLPQSSMMWAENNPKGAMIMSEITYTKQGDYLIPDLTLPTEPELQLGRYAMMHRNYLEQNKRVTYLNLLTSGKLSEHLYQTEQTALQRLELLTKQLSEEQGVTEELKEKAPMQWVGMMNNIRSQAEEVILTELIYK